MKTQLAVTLQQHCCTPVVLLGVCTLGEKLSCGMDGCAGQSGGTGQYTGAGQSRGSGSFNGSGQNAGAGQFAGTGAVNGGSGPVSNAAQQGYSSSPRFSSTPVDWSSSASPTTAATGTSYTATNPGTILKLHMLCQFIGHLCALYTPVQTQVPFWTCTDCAILQAMYTMHCACSMHKPRYHSGAALVVFFDRLDLRYTFPRDTQIYRAW